MKNFIIGLLVGAASALVVLSLVDNDDSNKDTSEKSEIVSAKNVVHPAAAQPPMQKKKPAMKTVKTGPSPGIPVKTGKLTWHHINDITAKDNSQKKKYIVDMYTDWCGWCKVMDNKTFTDPNVQDYIEDRFHLVKFNAEQKDPVEFKGKTYEWVPAGRKGVNKLALELMQNRLSYPTLVYLDEDMNLIKSSVGYKKPDQLLAELEQI